MPQIHYYGYNKCGSCRKALQWLAAHDVPFAEHAIVDDPPSVATLKKILTSGKYELKDLFNKSGVRYREMNMKDKLKDMSQAQALKLLADHGKLIKRPLITDGNNHTVGFKEDVMQETWG
ncbi:MAG: Spx/MgsR family RNA polymerase-binding regulatory protein [Phycisphaeraceae bacterium]|nr:Spx/MgsR family RNA polymerase-binding regulatory protein [Phycisphaeraceae bacterium]